MKAICAILLSLMVSLSALAEDIIHLQSGESIKANVIGVTYTDIKYKKASGSTSYVKKTDVLSVTSNNGSTIYERTYKTAKNGFTWIYVKENFKGSNSQYYAISVAGDTIVSSSRDISFYSNDIYGGYFQSGFSDCEIYNIKGEKILSAADKFSDCNLHVTKDSIPYFKVVKDKKFGYYDFQGREVVPIKYKQYKDDVDINLNTIGFFKRGKKTKLLDIHLPMDIDYRQIRKDISSIVKSAHYSTLPITASLITENDGYVWYRLSQGGYNGARDWNGKVIIPLDRKYSKVEYMPLKKGYGCFSFEKNLFAGVCTLSGQELIPAKREYLSVEFIYDTKNCNSDAVGFFKATDKYLCTEICDLGGKKIFSGYYDGIKFRALDGRIGYFEVSKRKKKSVKVGVVDMTGHRIFEPKYDWVHYNNKYGFSLAGKKNYSGICLDWNGKADYSLKNQWDREKKERRNRLWSNIGMAVLQTAAVAATCYAQAKSAQNSSRSYSSGSYSTRSSSGGTGNVAAQVSNPQYLRQVQNQLLALSIQQVQQQEMEEYNMMRQAYLKMGKDLTYQEYCVIKGQAIAALKEEGYDVIAEQKKINNDLHDFNRKLMNSGKENVERIKEQNNLKYGTSSTSGTTTYSSTTSGTTSNSVTTSGTKNSGTTTSNTNMSTTSSSTYGGTHSNNTNTTKNDAHEQFKDGNINTQSSSYGDKIKNVSLSVKDGASFRSVNKHGELYKKDAQYYVKMGNTFYRVFNTGGTKDSYIVYGETAHYFNK
ncbi:MAG: hypothetical protein ACI304_06375 [Lepagella sp.]